MENVPQLLRSAEYAAFKKAASKLEFEIVEDVLNAADFGVPQTRRRAIVIGSRLGVPPLPRQTHFRPDSGAPPSPRLAHAGGCDRRPAARSDGQRLAQPSQPEGAERREVPSDSPARRGTFRACRATARHHPRVLAPQEDGLDGRLRALVVGSPRLHDSHRVLQAREGPLLHPEEHRPLTVREAARCMSFPDDFMLPEDQSMTSIARQIGNAVPPLLAQRLGSALARHLQTARHASERRLTQAA
jgi:DNA (cytosine-5)-methyltransferase 1